MHDHYSLWYSSCSVSENESLACCDSPCHHPSDVYLVAIVGYDTCIVSSVPGRDVIYGHECMYTDSPVVSSCPSGVHTSSLLAPVSDV